jgi:diguanylate cyclase (GGDEF)-like protein/PAS domain S-box-containing protein
MRKPADIEIHHVDQTREQSTRRRSRITGLSSASALSESRETLQAVIDAVPAMVNVKGTDFRYIIMNTFQAELYGVSTDDAVGKTATALLGAEHGAYTENLDRQVIELGGPMPFFEEQFRDVHDVPRTLLTTKVPLRDRPGTIIGVVTVSLDISRRKDAEQSLRQSESKAKETMTLLTDAIDSMNDGFILLDTEHRPLLYNQRYREMYPHVVDLLDANTPLDELVAASVEKSGRYPDSDERENFVRERISAWKNGISMIEPGVGERWIETRDHQTDDGHLVGIRIDVTERRRSEEALEQSEQRYRSLFEAAPISLWEEDWSDVKKLVDNIRRGGVTDLNAAFRTDPELLVQAGASIRLLNVNEATLKIYHADDKKQLIDEHHRRLRTTPWPSLLEELHCLINGQRRVISESEDIRLDGGRFHIRTTIELPKAHEHDWRRVFAAVEDITEARALSQQLRFQASHDALTGLVNRREFENRLERAAQSAESGRSEHAVCYLDLDQFKIINDTSGHVAGDELLKRLGRVLAQQMRTQDTLARLGGDEFGVLLENCSLHVAERVANTLRRTIEDFRFVWEKQIFSIGVSIGVVPIQGPGQTVSSILSAADAACDAAKDHGRNRIHMYHEGDVELARRHGEMRWVTRIQTALEENRFELARQPIVPLIASAGADSHYELLVRMRDEDGDIVLPDAFLPAAERYNLSIKLDRWVVREAFRLLTQNQAHLDQLFLCSINLSGVSLADEDFLIFVTTEFASTGLPPGKICFEITETAAIANLSGAMRFIEVLRRIGCRFALDDFGSGLSSFAYLKSLPVDFLKIDGVFVKDIVENPIDRELVRSINQIGHVMGKRTIAEFVESREILAALKEIGVDYAQGFELGKPELLPKQQF